MTSLTDTYRKAHRRYPDRKYEKETDKQKHSQTMVRDSEKEGTGQKFQRQSTGCYVCGKRGHLARDCDLRFRRFNDPSTNRGASLEVVGEKYEEEEVTQSEIVEPESMVETEKIEPSVSACMQVCTEQCKSLNNQENNLKSACGHEIPVVSAAATNQNKMPVYKGLVGDTLVSVLRDTGCRTVVVKRDLVAKSNLTGKVKICLLLDGTLRELPEAIIEIDTPFYWWVKSRLCV
ncbi:hypothetical protein HOLleu_10450 [Holothuria leucospilota]|uniref:CCHC-type domain-containing protein n=1 Tax=Holothuria leucospilota TaxID=206669 RepID=A0A9Q1CEX3_HOLLE|nr:hypothetical protein HOLleu_10450 [Holothuria leucospilota]